jgi:ABC-type protease/lipase transport system fused ATPase/permease subunit
MVLNDGVIEQFGPRAQVLRSITQRPQVVHAGSGPGAARPTVARAE